MCLRACALAWKRGLGVAYPGAKKIRANGAHGALMLAMRKDRLEVETENLQQIKHVECWIRRGNANQHGKLPFLSSALDDKRLFHHWVKPVGVFSNFAADLLENETFMK